MEALRKNSIQSSNQLEVIFLNLFFLGFIIYSLAFTTIAIGLTIPILSNLFILLGVILFLPSLFMVIDIKIDSLYLKVLYFFYIAYLIFIIVRGFNFDFVYINILLIDAWYGIFIYFTPVVLMFPKKMETFKKLLITNNILSLSFIVLYVFSLKELFAGRGDEITILIEVLAKTLGLTSGFILFTFPYHSKRVNRLAIITLLLILVVSIFQARRGTTLYGFLIILFSTAIYFKYGKNRHLIIVASVMFFTTILLIGSEFFNKTSFFARLNERGLEDTRTKVELRFFEDMTKSDWIIGKGINGQYYCPGIGWLGEVSVYRSIIETDFLQIILKGGIISLGLLMLIFIPAVFLGLFDSNNLLVRAGALWILLGILNMYPSNINNFTLNYILMWFFTGIIYTKEFRKLSDNEITRLLK